MSLNPFVFGAGASQAGPAFPSQQQRDNMTQSSSSSFLTNNPPPGLSQQAALQQASQLSGIDMSALAGLSTEQWALIDRLLAAGQLPRPPPPPTVLGPATAPANVPPAPDAPSIQQDNTQSNSIDTEKEDGEIEDGEAIATPHHSAPKQGAPSGFLRAPPTGPRNSNSRGARRSSSFANQAPSTAPPQNAADAFTNGHIAYDDKELQTKEFVLALHQAGYSYRQLAEMMPNPRPIRRIFNLLGLPVTSDHSLANGSRPVQPLPQTQPPDPSFNAQTALKPAATRPTAPPKTAQKADRNDYLAKLQAAKAKKAGPASNQAVPPSQSSTDAEPSTMAAHQEASSAAAPPATTSTPKSKLVNNELIRQRLEALKAQQAVRQKQSAATEQTPTSSLTAVQSTPQVVAAESPLVTQQDHGLGAGLSQILSNDVQQPSVVTSAPPNESASDNQPSFTTASPTSYRPVGSIPGLFTPQQATSPMPPHQIRTTSRPIGQTSPFTERSSVPRKRLMVSASGSATPQAKRPFGQSRSASEDESFIIENSDEEDDDAPMNTDGNGSTTIPWTQAPLHASSLTTGMPSHSAIQPSSTSTTPDASVTGVATYEQKLKAIEDLNRRIAEREAKAKAQGKSPAGKVAVSAASVMPGLRGITASSKESSTPANAGTSILPKATAAAPDRPASAAAVKLRQEKEELRQRIAELENARKQTALREAEPGVEIASEVPAQVEYVSEALPSRPPSSAQAAAVTSLQDSMIDTGPQASEDGDVEDDSDYDFYGDEPEAGSASGQVEQVGSQATTASGVSNADIFAEGRLDTAAAAASQSASGAHNAEVVTDTSPDDSALDDLFYEQEIDRPVPNGPASADDAPGLGEEQATKVDPDTEREDEDSESEGESGEHTEEDDDDDPDGRLQTSMVQEREEVDGDLTDRSGVESLDASSDTSSESETYEPEPVEEAQNGQSVPRIKDAVADDPTLELQSSADPPPTEQPEEPADADSKTYYTPYESILTKFKDYRYHPQYLATVPGGYKSRTYNHQIDPEKRVCPSELQYGICNDKGCEWQHFDKMGISDNVLLQQMGTKSIPARDREGINRWNAGLQVVINSLKAANVRDAAAIAARIAEYRRGFVGDPTRIVHL